MTSFGYAYLIGSAVVAVDRLVARARDLRAAHPGRASTAGGSRRTWTRRRGSRCSRSARRPGIFAVAGGSILERVLGRAYGTDVGEEIGLLVVALAPWMVTSVGVSVTFPLVFVPGAAPGCR